VNYLHPRLRKKSRSRSRKDRFKKIKRQTQFAWEFQNLKPTPGPTNMKIVVHPAYDNLSQAAPYTGEDRKFPRGICDPRAIAIFFSTAITTRRASPSRTRKNRTRRPSPRFRHPPTPGEDGRGPRFPKPQKNYDGQ